MHRDLEAMLDSELEEPLALERKEVARLWQARTARPRLLQDSCRPLARVHLNRRLPLLPVNRSAGNETRGALIHPTVLTLPPPIPTVASAIPHLLPSPPRSP